MKNIGDNPDFFLWFSRWMPRQPSVWRTANRRSSSLLRLWYRKRGAADERGWSCSWGWIIKFIRLTSPANRIKWLCAICGIRTISVRYFANSILIITDIMKKNLTVNRIVSRIILTCNYYKLYFDFLSFCLKNINKNIFNSMQNIIGEI